MSTCKYCELEGRHSALCPANTIIELRAQVESLTQHLHDARIELAKYEAEPVVGYGMPSSAGIEHLNKIHLAGYSARLIRKPTSTEHLGALIDEAVAKEREECAKVCDELHFQYKYEIGMSKEAAKSIRARAQKGGE